MGIGSLGAPEIIIILALALIVFGPKKLPEIGRTIGRTIREVKKASQDVMDTIYDLDKPAEQAETVEVDENKERKPDVSSSLDAGLSGNDSDRPIDYCNIRSEKTS